MNNTFGSTQLTQSTQTKNQQLLLSRRIKLLTGSHQPAQTRFRPETTPFCVTVLHLDWAQWRCQQSDWIPVTRLSWKSGLSAAGRVATRGRSFDTRFRLQKSHSNLKVRGIVWLLLFELMVL